MRRLMLTAKTTVLPANDGPTIQKGLALCEAIRRHHQAPLRCTKGSTDEHDHHQGRHRDLLQGLGDPGGSADRLPPWLAVGHAAGPSRSKDPGSGPPSVAVAKGP